jgi:hypothetical protein
MSESMKRMVGYYVDEFIHKPEWIWRTVVNDIDQHEERYAIIDPVCPDRCCLLVTFPLGGMIPPYETFNCWTYCGEVYVDQIFYKERDLSFKPITPDQHKELLLKYCIK